VEGSAALALVASGVMIAALLSEPALSPEGAASAVAALGFFFVIFAGVEECQCIYIHIPHSNCVSVGRRQKTAAFDAVFGVVPTTPVQGRLSRRP
jgi:hypothetical protein